MHSDFATAAALQSLPSVPEPSQHLTGADKLLLDAHLHLGHVHDRVLKHMVDATGNTFVLALLPLITNCLIFPLMIVLLFLFMFLFIGL